MATSTLKTPLTELLGIQYPIMLAGMGAVSGHELVAAVSNAGGIGTLGGVMFELEGFRKEIKEVKKRLKPGVPFGVDLLIPKIGDGARATNKDYTNGNLPQMADIMIEEGVKLFVSAVGVPPKWLVDKLHGAGIICMNMVGAPHHVAKALEVGMDMICAQGTEAGGHTGDVATLPLIPQCVDACKGKKNFFGVEVPVVAAGGIFDGRGLGAALCLGAVGVWVGTRFICSEEANAGPVHKQRLMKALSARLGQHRIWRMNGVFMCAIAAFLQFRDKLVREHGHTRDKDDQELTETPSAVVVTPDGHVADEVPEAALMAGPTLGPGNLPRSQEEVAKLQLQYTSTPLDQLPRFIVFGAISGALLGFFGVGPAWVIAPLVTRTSPEWQQIAALASKEKPEDTPAGPARPDEGGPLSVVSDLIGTTGCDERTRRTCALATVVPCIAAAWRHWNLGHVAEPKMVAFPLAGGAIFGSIAAGQFLADIPPDSDTRLGLSAVIFAYGAWSFLAPR